MNKSWTISAILVLSIAIPGLANFERGPDGPAQDRHRGSAAGRMVADSLVRDCSIFIGTLYEVEGPETEPTGVDRRELSYSKVTIKVDEWLRGEPERWGQEISLRDVPVVIGAGSESRGYIWRGVKLAVGGRLVVAFPPGEIIRGQPLTSIHRYWMAVSDESLFPSIRSAVGYHELCLRDPEAMLEAPGLVESDPDMVFTSYLVRYLWWTQAGEHRDVTAILLTLA